ncbi:MAG TPA: DUF1570 domain-containing protein [Planctomycetota bacterium]|nr:DUF1570 domain-containing protein [Planctomycetota bacterium]
MRRSLMPLAFAAAAALAAAEEPRRARLPANLPKTATRFYDIYSKLDEATLREAGARLTAMAKDYHRRTSGFPRQVRSKLPIYLFDSMEAYLAAGGLKGSHGVYLGEAVLGVCTPGRPAALWDLLQHECWHQFARQSVGGRWPPWLNEGLAEYYSEALWTGDEFVTGVISPFRLARVQAAICAKKLKPLLRFVDMDQKTWNADVATENYDQAWSLVHFLAHGPNERYRDALVALIKAAAQSKPPLESFRGVFGRKANDLQGEWEQWCLSLKPDATRDRYLQAIVGTLTSFLARAHAQGLRFKSAADFLAAGRDGRLVKAAQASKALWLPASLLEANLKLAERLRTWTLDTGGASPVLRLRIEGLGTLTGSFDLQGSRSVDVNVRVTRD